MKKIILFLTTTFVFIAVSGYAQQTTEQHSSMEKGKSANVKYSCPMHPEVSSDKPGKCSKCGMDLVKKEKAKSQMYSCPMHPEVSSDKPGKCSKCGMDLKLSEKEKVKAESVALYACPMKCEGNKTYDKPGKCPVCGMALKEKKADNNHQH